MKEFPTRFYSRLYHIGTLNRADKGRRGPSHEGHGMSVSTHPQAWREIARLGGLPTWRLTKKAGVFLDIHRVGPRRRRLMEEWAVAQGLVRRATGHRVIWHDDDLDRDCCMLFENREQAEGESEGRGTPEETPIVVATTLLEKRIGFRCDPGIVPDMVAICYTEDVLQLDGVWWHDQLDIQRYSAPRGVILPARVPEWAATLCAPPARHDDGIQRTGAAL